MFVAIKLLTDKLDKINEVSGKVKIICLEFCEIQRAPSSSLIKTFNDTLQTWKCQEKKMLLPSNC